MNKKQLDTLSDVFHSAWLEGQVESHLFFGDYPHKKKIIGAIYLCLIIFGFVEYRVFDFPLFDFFKESGRGLGLLGILIAISLFKYNYQLSAFYWGAFKFSLLFIGFIFILMGFVNTLAGKVDGPLLPLWVLFGFQVSSLYRL